MGGDKAIPARNPDNHPSFRQELATAINRCSMENGSDTPDFILAQYLIDCLKAFDYAQAARNAYYSNREQREAI